MQSKVAELTASLSEAQAEKKALTTKLAANRTAAASVQSIGSKVPGSAKKNPAVKTLMVGSAEAAQAAQIAQLKEDLYSDLTGLILRGVKREEEEDVFDCIQTGRNGSMYLFVALFSLLSQTILVYVLTTPLTALHFRLAVANESQGGSYTEASCNYTPLLDENRDKALLQLLPEYLTEEIMFPREHAGRFYARVAETLTKKRE